MLVRDTVTLAPDLVIKNQLIGVASSVQGFSDVDGVLGIGSVDLKDRTFSSSQPSSTITNILFAQGAIPEDSFGISYEPASSDDSDEGVVDGELTFGGADSLKYVAFTHATLLRPRLMSRVFVCPGT